MLFDHLLIVYFSPKDVFYLEWRFVCKWVDPINHEDAKKEKKKGKRAWVVDDRRHVRDTWQCLATDCS